MKVLLLSLTLGTFLSLSRAMALNDTSATAVPRYLKQCEIQRERAEYLSKEYHILGLFVPECDSNGNYLPQQCSGGYCWCVNVNTGDKIPNTETGPGVTPVDCYHDSYCPTGWSRYGKRCFMFIDSPKTWIEAESYCLFEVANLASIHSYEENLFIAALTRADTYYFPLTWIGGHDLIYFNFWIWTDGSKFNYVNWPGEKNNDGHCLLMNEGHDLDWNCFPCNTTLPFVCAKTI